MPIAARASDTQSTAQEQNSPTIVLDTMTVSTVKERLKTYETATKTFWYATQETRCVSYLDVIAVAYDKAEFDLADTLLKKKKYREQMLAKGHDFFCNYAAIDVKVPALFRNMISGPPGLEGGPREWVYYDFKRRVILVERELYYSSLMHAVGLSLCGSPSPEALERIKKIGAEKKDFEFRRQVNFEVQLQDLNRLYALYTKRPIMTPLDALEALCMLGEKPKANTVESIFKRSGFKADPALIKKILANTKQRQAIVMYDPPSGMASAGPANNGPESFLGAHRLMTGLVYNDEVINPGLRRESGRSYEAYLERILIEAPGHI
jgi:hypothetical protein